MPDTRHPDEPRDFTDLPIQPTGSGVADTEIAMMQAAVAPDEDAADAPPGTGAEAGIADETAAYDRAMRTDDDDAPTKTQG